MQVLSVLSEDFESRCTGVDRRLKLDPRHMSDESSRTYVAEVMKKPGQSKRAYAIDGKHIV